MKPKILATLYLALPETQQPASGPAVPPVEFRIFPFGKHTSEKGDFTFDKDSAKSVLAAAARKGNDFPIDYEHNMVLPNGSVPGDGPTPAAGWFKLDVKDDGLYAINVRWTPRALKYLAEKEYRYFSPAFLQTDGHVEELVNVALTNTPATHYQTPLIAASTRLSEENPPMKALLAALKLGEGATESEALVALERLREEGKKLVALTGKENPVEAMGVIHAWKDAAARTATSEEALAAIKAEKREQTLQALVAKGLKDRKIAPAKKEEFLKIGKQKGGLKLLKAYLEAASPMVGTKHKEAPDGKVTVVMTDDQVKLAQQLGVTPQQIAERMAAHRGAVPTAPENTEAN